MISILFALILNEPIPQCFPLGDKVLVITEASIYYETSYVCDTGLMFRLKSDIASKSLYRYEV